MPKPEPEPLSEHTTFRFTSRPKRPPHEEERLSHSALPSRKHIPVKSEPELEPEVLNFTSQQVNSTLATWSGAGPRSRTFSVSTTSTVSTSFKLGLEDTPTTSPPRAAKDEVLPGMQDLSITDIHQDLELDTSSSSDMDSVRAGDEPIKPTPSGSLRTHRRRHQRKKRKANKKAQAQAQNHMPVVEELRQQAGRDGHREDGTDIVVATTNEDQDGEEGRRTGKGQDQGQGKRHRHDGDTGKSNNSNTGKEEAEEAEVIMAIWGLAELDMQKPHLHLLGGGKTRTTSFSVEMCMDEAGRWRVGWGQLVD